MASLTTSALLAVAATTCGCSNLQGLGGAVPPLASIQVEVTGDLAAVRPPDDPGTPDLHVALVWGDQWLVEPLCILPPESADAATVIAAGCRDPFGFVPARVDANVAVTIGEPATIDLFALPAADVLVGDLTARVGYGSLVIYDDRDGNGTLTLARPNRPNSTTGGPPVMDPTPTLLPALVYGASFASMTAPDVRLAYREGVFVQTAFYPRAGCGDPPPAYSVLAAGGFSASDAIAATLAGMLPQEDPASCTQAAPDASTISIALAPPAGVSEVACTERNADSSVRYREPDTDMPDFTNRVSACVHVPTFGAPSDVIELVVSGRSDDACKGLTHYILKGCRESPDCGTPDWDHSTAPPLWWPC